MVGRGFFECFLRDFLRDLPYVKSPVDTKVTKVRP